MERHKIFQKKYVKILCKQEKPDVEVVMIAMTIYRINTVHVSQGKVKLIYI